MSLRSKILTSSLPLIQQHSFTRQTLSLALTTLPKDDPDHRSDPLDDSVVDTLFGPGQSAAKQLVDAWTEEGRVSCSRPEAEASPSGIKPENSLVRKLIRRLEYSAEVGEHLVEAYALLSSPASTSSLPIPNLPIPLKQLLGMRVPPLYSPPQLRALHGTLNTTDSILSAISERTGGRLPLLRFNPIGPLSYAWGIADEALYTAEKATDPKIGVMGEPVGAGPEWYLSRLSLSLAYLSAESQLLQPFPRLLTVDEVGMKNPHLPVAINTLHRNLQWYHSLGRSVNSVEKGAGETMGFLDFVGKSWIGLIRSRYW